jgi:hypothetical protein
VRLMLVYRSRSPTLVLMLDPHHQPSCLDGQAKSLASVRELSAEDLSLTACLYPDENVFGSPNELLHISSPLSRKATMPTLQSPSCNYTNPYHNTFNTTSCHGPSSLSQSTPHMPPQPFTYLTPLLPPHTPFYPSGASP